MARNTESLAGKSWILGTIDTKGAFGVLQVFDIAKYSSASDSGWAAAGNRAREAAYKAQGAWQHHYSRTRPTDQLVVRLMDGDRCTAVINRA